MWNSNYIVSATGVFDLVTIPDIVSWTLIILGLSNCGIVEEAIVKFISMDLEPNIATQPALVTVLSSCSSLRAFKFGKVVPWPLFEELTLE